MAHRTIQVVLDTLATFDSTKRFWKLALFNDQGEPIEFGEGASVDYSNIMGTVVHGADPDVPRLLTPGGAPWPGPVMWIGTVDPVNALPDDVRPI